MLIEKLCELFDPTEFKFAIDLWGNRGALVTTGNQPDAFFHMKFFFRELAR